MASPSTWSRAAMNHSWGKRTLRVLVWPPPITFAERRSVLHVLQQTGAVDVFRMVPNYPSQYLAVTRDADTAESLLTSSPVTYSIASPKTSDAKFIDLSRPDVLDGTKAMIHPPSIEHPTTDEVNNDEACRNFTLRIVKVYKYNHAATMSSSALHGPWPASYTDGETFISSVLRQSLPQTVAAKGLERWEYDVRDKATIAGKNERFQISRWTKMKRHV